MLNGKEGRLLRRNNDKDTRMKINILLCDDDKDFLQRISDAVAGQPVPPGASICITKSSNPAEITDRQLSQYHIMFLDIDMDERSGMDIARRVRELHLDTVIIFVTNYPEFSMEGYEVRAFRYLLKQELEQKLPNYFRDALAELPRDDKVLHFSANAESFNIPYKDILYLESNQRVKSYIFVHSKAYAGTRPLLRKNGRSGSRIGRRRIPQNSEKLSGQYGVHQKIQL